VKTEILPAREVQRAVKILTSGGLVAFPTDTVYGLGALAFDQDSIKSIYRAKDRPVEKAIPILIGDIDDLELVAAEVPQMALIFAARFWPGPLTCVVPKNQKLPSAVSATPTVAVRVPDHADARALLRAAGPMAVTSANISGGLVSSTAQEVLDQLNGRIPLILDGGSTLGGVPSTVVDCTGDSPTILRGGPISLEALLIALG